MKLFYFFVISLLPEMSDMNEDEHKLRKELGILRCKHNDIEIMFQTEYVTYYQCHLCEKVLIDWRVHDDQDL